MPVRNMPFYAPYLDQHRRPYLRVEYQNPDNDRTFKAYALIDTGAYDCLLPDTYAATLGHDLKKGKQYRIDTVSGLATGYYHTTKITIPGFATEECLIGFMPGLKTPILGVKSFLANFTLTIEYPKECFSLRK